MVGSELMHNSIATLALFTGLIIAGAMFDIPAQYRAAAQIWQSLPMSFLSRRGIFSEWLIAAGGQCFTAWQAVPLLYVIGGAVAAAAGAKIYRRYQVSGR